MALHFKKDGSLDMRYSSSRAAMSSGSGSINSFASTGGGGRSPISSGQTAFSGLQYRKDGGLDMRYSSSRAAMSSGFGSMNSFASTGGGGRSPISSGQTVFSGLQYRKDDGLDMRYTSSKAEASSNPTNRSSSHSGLHYKKDGTLDMRYSSSKAAASSNSTNRSSSHSGLHYKKDGTLDMRYASSKSFMSKSTPGCAFSDYGIPKYIPLTKDGIPDMRTKAAKEWVREQAQNGGEDIPFWIPKVKDGSPDLSKPITQEYLQWKELSSASCDPDRRLDYYMTKLEDLMFRALVESAREADVETPSYETLPETPEIQRQFCSPASRNFNRQADECDIPSQISESVSVINYNDLNINQDNKIGQGSFGTVYKAVWNNQNVAVKQLHLDKLTRQEKKSFLKEITIMSALGEHTNLVYMYGYTLAPPCIVMEYAELGSLTYLLHYCEDGEIEARITDGRIKKKIILGTVLGMI